MISYGVNKARNGRIAYEENENKPFYRGTSSNMKLNYTSVILFSLLLILLLPSFIYSVFSLSSLAVGITLAYVFIFFIA